MQSQRIVKLMNDERNADRASGCPVCRAKTGQTCKGPITEPIHMHKGRKLR